MKRFNSHFDRPLPLKEMEISELTQRSLAKQSFKEQCDINNIIAKAQMTGELPPINANLIYGDFSNAESFQEQLNKVNLAKDAFNALPAKLRNRFENDPAQLIDFVQNEANYDEAVYLGLIEKKPAPPAPIEEPKV